jgi:hypothetical protein
MNNILDQSTMTGDAIFGTTLEIISGQLRVRTQGITSSELAAGAVTSNAIADGTIVNADISPSAAIEPSKLGTGPISATATVTTGNVVDGSITAPKLNGAQTGNAPIYGVRAWGRFDGTGASPITPIYGGNIASITRSSLGVFVVLFTTPMIDANYSVVVSGNNPIQSNNQAFSTSILSSVTANGFTITYASTSANPSIVCFQVIR